MNLLDRFVVGSGRVCWLLVVLLAGCNGMLGLVVGPSLRGSGIPKTETREAASFSEIEVGNAIQLDATIGEPNSVVVTADDNLLPHLKTVVDGNRLKIHVDVSHSSSLGIQVKVSTPELTAIEGSGASKITATGVAAEQFQLDLSGASTCELTGDASSMDVTLSGASRSVLAGESKQLAIECSGASHVDATKFSADSVTAELSGASSARVNAADELATTVSGASTLRYAGHPSKLSKQVSGASSIAAEQASPNSLENVERPL